MHLQVASRVYKGVGMYENGLMPDTRWEGESGELTEGLEVFDGHKLGLCVVNGS